MARRFRIPADHPFAPQIPARLLKIASSERGVAMTRVQAEAIGSMRLIQLVGLEIEKITADYGKVVAEIEDYEAILADRERVLRIIKDDIAQMRERYDRPRRTSIEESADDIDFGRPHPGALGRRHHLARGLRQGAIRSTPTRHRGEAVGESKAARSPRTRTSSNTCSSRPRTTTCSASPTPVACSR